MTDTLQRSTETPPSRPAARPGRLLAVLLTGQFMAILDVSIVNVAAPAVRADLHASGSGLQLVISGYTIAYAMLLIVGARLGHLAGHRKVFQTGLAVFTLTSLACGLASTTGQLITFRLLQGGGAALMVPQVLSLIQRTFDGPSRGRALSVYAAVIAGGAVIGQILGGVLVSADLFGAGWRPVFLVNVPIGVVLLAVAARLLPSGRGQGSRGLDLPGMLALSVAVVLCVSPLVLGHEQDWPLWGWISLACGVLSFAVFVAWERATARRGRAPLVSGRVLRAPATAPAAVAMLLCMATYAGFLFCLALHLQAGLGESALHAGLLFIPGAGGFALTSLTWRYIPARLLRAVIPSGYLLGGLGYLGLALAVRGGEPAGVALEVSLACIGLGLGAAFSPLLSVALTHVATADAADASGLLVMVTQLGQVVGVATFGTLFLTLADGPGAGPSAHATTVTGLALAVTAAAAAGATLLLPRRA